MAGQPPARDSFKGPPSGEDKIMPFFYKVWVVTPNLPTYLLLIAFEVQILTHNGSFLTTREFFLKLRWELSDNPPDVF